MDLRPPAIRNFLAYSLQRLGARPYRHLPPGAARSRVPIEEVVGRARGAGAGRRRPPHRPLRGRRRDAAPRRRGASDLRPADRVLADLARHRGRDPAGGARARHRHHRLRRAVARPDRRRLAATARGAGRLPPSQPALPGRATPRPTSRWSRRCARSPRRAASPSPRPRSPGLLAQGADIVPLVGTSAATRLAEALARRAALGPDDLAAIEARGAEGRRRRHALRRGADGDARQRAC